MCFLLPVLMMAFIYYVFIEINIFLNSNSNLDQSQVLFNIANECGDSLSLSSIETKYLCLKWEKETKKPVWLIVNNVDF